VDAGARFQTIQGFGGAITEAAVHVFGQLGAAAQAALLEDLYGENAQNTSLRYSLGRLTIGSCDFSLGYYSYNDKANDTAMANFTIAHDEAAIIPFILAAQNATAAAGRPLRFLSSPWSPPACAYRVCVCVCVCAMCVPASSYPLLSLAALALLITAQG
jgi:glucosylceramidase